MSTRQRIVHQQFLGMLISWHFVNMSERDTWSYIRSVEWHLVQQVRSPRGVNVMAHFGEKNVQQQ
jgi:hypothetical protein